MKLQGLDLLNKCYDLDRPDLTGLGMQPALDKVLL